MSKSRPRAGAISNEIELIPADGGANGPRNDRTGDHQVAERKLPTGFAVHSGSRPVDVDVALEPSLVLPMVAFLTMAAVTRLLARRLFQDLTGVQAQAD
ncbi:hypothetical protein GFK91_00700 [Roseibium aggregatum]|uniref:hypothetical protein n=1 Tax=Roseibium aggregatum TaxID=187304 RepID=UPI001E58A97B|nr:hypothetical protein [Roseibium aggregatum]UES54244.1 hypothetical protein GFK91_00700 [Roseibium aggregatum]